MHAGRAESRGVFYRDSSARSSFGAMRFPRRLVGVGDTDANRQGHGVPFLVHAAGTFPNAGECRRLLHGAEQQAGKHILGFTRRVILTIGLEPHSPSNLPWDPSLAQFNSLEPEICRIFFVSEVEFVSVEGSASIPPKGATEIPNCPVCLERLDHRISGVLTTVCNHTFHCTCLSKWADTSCPVCRYILAPPEASACQECGSEDSLWMCLICGYLGCGRYHAGHAREHWLQTDHCYCLELATQRVWDYVGAHPPLSAPRQPLLPPPRAKSEKRKVPTEALFVPPPKRTPRAARSGAR
eukprot:1164357-Prorocentrum_minimum.AAC.1